MTSPPEPKPANAAALAAVASEVEGLRRAVDPLREVSGRVDDLARLVAHLVDALAAAQARPGPTPAPSWLMLPIDAPTAGRVLDELTAWMAAVYLRYSDAVSTLPECWCWHPDIVEELLWLMHAWCAAYQGKGASVALVGDWHDRSRPGVVRRVRAVAGSCSLENHMTREGWSRFPAEAPAVPTVEAVELIASWWGPRRGEPAPEPSPDPLADRHKRRSR